MANRTLLLVDDDPEIRTVLGLYLARRGFTVIEAHDGPEGLDRFFAKGADVILLDALLPRLDGMGFLRALRADPRGGEVPVIVMSAVHMPLVFRGEEAERLGISGFLTKPFQLRQVLQLVQQSEGGQPQSEPLPKTPSASLAIRPRRFLAPRAPVPASGDLGQRPLADLIPALATEARSGRLTLMAGEVVKQVVFRNGVPVFAGSTLLEETLGQYLVRAGVLDAGRLGRLVEIAAGRGAKLGETILAERVMAPLDLYERIRDHMTEKVVRAFAWSEGRFEFSGGEHHAAPHTLARMDVPHLVLDGVLGHMEAEAIAKHLPMDREAHAFFRADAPYPLEALPLDPRRQRLTHLLRRGETLGAVATELGESLEEVRRGVYALYVLRVVGLQVGEGDEQSPARRGSVEVPRRRAASGPLPHARPASAEAVASLIADYLRVKGKDHFAVLGVPRSACSDEVRAAHARWMARLDPASLPPEVTGEMRDRAEELLRAIEDAHATLSDPALRAEYERTLAAEAVAGRHDSVVDEREFGELRAKVREGRAAEVIEPLRRMLRRAPSEPAYALQLAFALLQVDPRAHHDEVERLATRARLGSPDMADPYYVLGRLAVLAGDAKRAEHLFRQALARDPHHQGAEEGLYALSSRR